MSKLTLYHAAPSRSSIVHWMLEELGEPYDIQLVSFKKGENRQPEFLAINPMGKLPTIKHGDTVITEAAAICTYLADEFPQAKLNIPVGNPQRGVYLKWLFFGPSCFEPAITERAFPRKQPPPRSTLGFGDFETVMDVMAKGVGAAKPYLMGSQFTVADAYLYTTLTWASDAKVDLQPFASLRAYRDRVAARPAVQAARKAEGLPN